MMAGDIGAGCGDLRVATAPRRAATVDIRPAELDAFVASLADTASPGAVFGVSLGGEPIYRGAAGYARLEGDVPLTPATPMAIGSITKHFVCMTYLGLCRDHGLTLDASVRSFLPELERDFGDVTVRQLMAHVSGLRDAYDLAATFGASGSQIAAAAVLAQYARPIGFNALPGTRYCYNNGAYMLLARIIERAGGGTLEDILARGIFAPAGMTASALHRFDPVDRTQTSACHVRDGAGIWRIAPRAIEGLGMGGIYSSIDDMLRWLACIEHATFGFADFWRDMITPQKLLDGRPTGYGLGIGWTRYRGLDTVGHAGGVAGASAQMLKVPALDLDIVTISNRADLSATALALSLLDRCVLNLDDEPVAASGGSGAIYYSAETGKAVVLSPDNGPQHAVIDGLATPLADLGDDGFGALPWADPARLTLRLSSVDAGSDTLALSAYGSYERLSRIACDTPTRRVGPGAYTCVSAGIEARVSGEGRSLLTNGPFGSRDFVLDHLAGALWHVRSSDQPTPIGVLAVENDSQFSFSNTRNRGLNFERTEPADRYHDHSIRSFVQ